MLHLPSGFGIPQWPLSFGQLGPTLVAMALVALVLLGAALVAIPRRTAGPAPRRKAGATGRPSPRRPPLRVVAARPPHARLRRIV